jgi:hypothetical protein
VAQITIRRGANRMVLPGVGAAAKMLRAEPARERRGLRF